MSANKMSTSCNALLKNIDDKLKSELSNASIAKRKVLLQKAIKDLENQRGKLINKAAKVSNLPIEAVRQAAVEASKEAQKALEEPGPTLHTVLNPNASQGLSEQDMDDAEAQENADKDPDAVWDKKIRTIESEIGKSPKVKPLIDRWHRIQGWDDELIKKREKKDLYPTIDRYYKEAIRNKYSDFIGSIPKTTEYVPLNEIVNAIVYSDDSTPTQVEDKNKQVETLQTILNSKLSVQDKTEAALREAIKFFDKRSRTTKNYGTVTEAMFLEDKLSKEYFEGVLNLKLNQDVFSADSALDAFTSRAKKPRSLLAFIPAISEILKSNELIKAILPKGTKLNAFTGKGKREFLRFRNEFEKVLNEKILPSLDKEKSKEEERGLFRKITEDGTEGWLIGEDFSRAPLHYLRDKNGNLPSNVVTAMAAQAITWMGTTGTQTVFNDADAIARLLGYKNGYQVPKAAIREFATRGTIRPNFVDQIGAATVRTLNLAVNSENSIDGLMERKLADSFGLLISEAMAEMDYIEINDMEAKKFNSYRPSIEEGTEADISEVAAISDDAKVVFVRIGAQKTPKGNIVLSDKARSLSDSYKRARFILEKALNVASREKRILEEDEVERTQRTEKTIRRSLMEVDSTTAKQLKKFQPNAIKINPRTAHLFKAFGSSDTFKREIMDYVDPNEVLKAEEESQIGKNLATDREVDAFAEALDGRDINRYFTYSVKRNFRTMTEALDLDYQNNKGLHRVGLVDPSWETKISAKEIKKFLDKAKAGNFKDVPEHIQELMASIAFGLGIKVDGKSIDKAVEDADLWAGIYEALTDPEKPFRPAIEALKDHHNENAETLTEEQIALVGEASREGGERGWSLLALDTWAEFERSAETGQEFTNYMPMEVDGLTNGLAIIFLQLPSTDEEQRWTLLNRVGIFKKGHVINGREIRSFADLLKAFPDTRDNYEEAAIAADRTLRDVADRNNTAAVLEIGAYNSVSKKREILDKETQAKLIESLRGFYDQASRSKESAFMDIMVDANGDPTAFARKMFKQSVMTSGGYAAGAAAVKNQMAVSNPYGTTPIEMFYKHLRKIAHTDNVKLSPEQKLQIIKDMILRLSDATAPIKVADKNLQKSFNQNFVFSGSASFLISPVTDLENKIKKLKSEDAKQKAVWDFARNYEIHKDVVRVVQKRTAETLGNATNMALEDILGTQHTLRNNLLTAMEIIAHVSKLMFDKKLKEFININDRFPSEKEIRDIRLELVDEGWGSNFPHMNSDENNRRTHLEFGETRRMPVIDWLNENGYDGNKDLLERTKTQLGIRAGSATGQASVGNSVKFDLPEPASIGVSGFVRAIQSMDGGIMAKVFSEHKIFHVFDAFMAGINSIRRVTKDANKAFLEANAEYSLNDAVIDRLLEIDKMLQDAVDAGIITETEKNIATHSFRGVGPDYGYKDVISTLKQQKVAVKETRDQLFDEIGVVNQFSKSNSPYLPVNELTAEEVNIFAEDFLDALGSSPVDAAEIASKHFETKYDNVLQTETLKRILDDIYQFENIQLDKDHQEQLDLLRDHILIPGMDAIDNIALKIVENPNGSINWGKMRTLNNAPNDIFISVGGNVKTNPNEMSLQETVHHEIIHAVTYAFIEGNQNYFGRVELEKLFNRAKDVITPEDFLANPATATQYERELAQERYDYVFNNPEGNRLHEFVALGLTNKPFAQALKKVQYSAKEELIDELGSKDAWLSQPFRQLMNLVLKALEWLTGSSRQLHSGNVGDNLFKLVQNVVALNNRNSVRATEGLQARLQKGSEQLNEWTRGKAAQIIVAATSRHWEKPERAKKVLKYSIEGPDADQKKDMEEMGINPEGIGLKGIGAKLHEVYKENLKELGMPEDRLGEHLAQEFFGLVDRAKNFRNIRREAATKIDTLRQRLNATMAGMVRDSFGRKLSNTEKKALNEVLLRTNLSTLLNKYNFNQVMGFLTDPSSIRREIRETHQTLKANFGRNGIAYGHQAKSLGSIMARGTPLKNVLMPQMNAHNIAHLRMFSEDVREPVGNLEEAEQLIDNLASLYALQYTDPQHINNIQSLIQEEAQRGKENGLAAVLAYHAGVKEVSLAKNFNGNKVNTYAGYTSEQFNANVKIDYKPTDPATQKQMAYDGYELVSILPKDPMHINVSKDSKPVGMYVSQLGLNRYRAGPMSLTNPSGRGSDIIEPLVEQLGPWGNKEAQRQVDEITKRAQQGALRQFQEDLDTDTVEQSLLVPIYSPNTGEPVNMRYLMSDANKVKYLKRDDKIDENLGRMYGHIHDKANTPIINHKVVDAIYDDSLELRKREPDEYEYIGLDAKNQQDRDAFRMLPKETQIYIKKKTGVHGIWVRKNMRNYIFGYREVSLTGAVHEKYINHLRKNNKPTTVPHYIWMGARIGEDVWKEIVSFARLRTSVQLPAVVVGNIVSNLLVLASDGIPPKYILEKTKEALHAMRSYQRQRQERDELTVKIASITAKGGSTAILEKRLNDLNANLRSNPVHEMVQEGMFQAIVEDVNPEAFQPAAGHHLQRLGQKAGEWFESQAAQRNIGFASHGLSLARNLAMLPGTQTFAAVMAANQYGDFVARYAMYKYDTEVRKMDKQNAIDKSMDAFIYYDEPSDPRVAALNDYGIFMFWKFYARIQRVVYRLFKEKPATTIMAHLIDQNLLDDQGIVPYFLNAEKALNRIETNPYDIVKKAIGAESDAPFGLMALSWGKAIIPGW